MSSHFKKIKSALIVSTLLGTFGVSGSALSDNLNGIYSLESELKIKDRMSEIEIGHCNSGSCRLTYRYHDHHICEFEGNLKVTSTSKAEFDQGRCHFDLSIGSRSTLNMNLSQNMERICASECNDSSGIISGEYLKVTGEERPSFDCKKARTPREKFICDVPTLAQLDRRISEDYAAILAHLEQKRHFNTKQRQWLKESEETCFPSTQTDCLLDSLYKRLKDLTGLRNCLDQARILKRKTETDEVRFSEGLSTARNLIKNLKPGEKERFVFPGNDLENESAKKVFDVTVTKELLNRIPPELASTLQARSMWCNSLNVQVNENYLLFNRVACGSPIDRLLLEKNGGLWTVFHGEIPKQYSLAVVRGPMRATSADIPELLDTAPNKIRFVPTYQDWRGAVELFDPPTSETMKAFHEICGEILAKQSIDNDPKDDSTYVTAKESTVSRIAERPSKPLPKSIRSIRIDSGELLVAFAGLLSLSTLVAGLFLQTFAKPFVNRAYRQDSFKARLRMAATETAILAVIIALLVWSDLALLLGSRFPEGLVSFTVFVSLNTWLSRLRTKGRDGAGTLPSLAESFASGILGTLTISAAFMIPFGLLYEVH